MIGHNLKPFEPSAELEIVARKTVWFKKPSDALALPFHFVAHVLTYGTHEDVLILRRHVSDEDLREARKMRLPAFSMLDHGRIGI